MVSIKHLHNYNYKHNIICSVIKLRAYRAHASESQPEETGDIPLGTNQAYECVDTPDQPGRLEMQEDEAIYEILT